MPVVKIDMRPATKEVKKELIEKVSKTISDVTKGPISAITVLISEKDADNIGSGGVQVTELLK